jgi:hypothetical protein
MEKVDIFYKSYAKDFKWLYKSLESLEKYCTGYNQIIVVVPYRDLATLDGSKLIKGVTVVPVDERTKDFREGYLYQQWIKMSAHNYCQSDYIMYADSDVLFNRPVNVQDLINNGKSTILYTPYDKVGDAICWKQPTDRFMNATQEYEFMRRLPLIYKRSTIQKINELEPRLHEIIMSSERFSEFNVMGAWAFTHERDQYNFINTDNWEFEENFVDQFWSHSGLNELDEKRINEILK